VIAAPYLHEFDQPEGSMHIHNHPTNFNAVDLYSSKAAEKAASAQQVADVRRKLIRGGLDIKSEENPFESFMVGQGPESGSRRRQGPNKKQNHPNNLKGLQHADEERADEPLSFWA
jgi:hypothetical protein